MHALPALLLVLAGLLLIVGARRWALKLFLLGIGLAFAWTFIERGVDALSGPLDRYTGALILVVLVVLTARAYLGIRVQRRRLNRILGERPESAKRRVERG